MDRRPETNAPFAARLKASPPRRLFGPSEAAALIARRFQTTGAVLQTRSAALVPGRGSFETLGCARVPASFQVKNFAARLAVSAGRPHDDRWQSSGWSCASLPAFVRQEKTALPRKDLTPCTQREIGVCALSGNFLGLHLWFFRCACDERTLTVRCVLLQWMPDYAAISPGTETMECTCPGRFCVRVFDIVHWRPTDFSASPACERVTVER